MTIFRQVHHLTKICLTALDLLELYPEGTVEEYYDITVEIGRGGFSKVYKAIPRDDPSQEVAIKIIYKVIFNHNHLETNFFRTMN